MRAIRLDSKYANKKVAEMTGSELAQVIAAAIDCIEGGVEMKLENIEMMLGDALKKKKLGG